MTQQDIRRRPDGSIDFDFYRALGETERRRAMDSFIRRIGRIGPVLASAVVARAYAIIARNTGNGLSVMAVTSKASHIPHPDRPARLGSILSR